GVHHVQAAFVDQPGLVRLPLVPGLLRDVVVDVLTLGPRIGRPAETGQFLFVLAAHHGAGHGDSPAFTSAAARLSSFFTGAASPRGGGVARLYQSQSPSATPGAAGSSRPSQGSMTSWKWLKVWVRAGSSRRSPRCGRCLAASGARALRSSSSGRLQSPPQSPLEG